MKTIIVATDFSPAALNAANYAADMALAIKADILLLHVYQIPEIYLEVPVAFSEEEMIYDAEKELMDLKKVLAARTAGKLHIGTKVLPGVFFPELKTVCEQMK